MKYECLVLAPTPSYLHDVVGECNVTLDESEDGELSYDELQKRFHAVTNSVHGVYAMLCNRWTMLELRGQLEQEPGSSQRGGADALHAKLQFVEDTVYQAADGVVADEVLQQWLNDFHKKRGKAVLMSAASKSAANADARVVKDHRDQRWKKRKKYDDEKDKEAYWQRRKKGQWDPVQVVLGLEMDLKLGQFRVTERRISAQLPRYYAAWKDPRCEGVDSLAYEWRGENNWVNPPWALLHEVAHKLREEGAAATVVALYWPASKVTVGSRIEVFWKDDDCFYPVVVKEFNEDGKAHALYDDGDEETLDLSEENFKIICSSGVSELTDETPDVNGEYIDCGGDYKENKRDGAVENFLTRSLWEKDAGTTG
eukprot:gene34302-biopygen24641